MRAFHASDLQDPLALGHKDPRHSRPCHLLPCLGAVGDLVGTIMEVVAGHASTLARTGAKRHRAAHTTREQGREKHWRR